MFYKALVSLRSDVSNFNTEQLLRKDVKFGAVALPSESKNAEASQEGSNNVKYAISTVPLSLEVRVNLCKSTKLLSESREVSERATHCQQLIDWSLLYGRLLTRSS